MTTGRPRRIVVVGHGIAGLTASDALRSAGFDGELTVVGEEQYAPYSRPALSKAALLDDQDMTSHLLPEPSHGAAEILGLAAVDLDTARRIVRLSDGTEVPYDAVVIASGSRARRLGEAGLQGRIDAELTLRGLDDALELRRRIADQPSVVVVGGGALGMEVASGCVTAGCRVTLVSRRPPLQAQLGPYLSDVFTGAALRSGVTMRSSATVGLRDSAEGAVVTLDDGTEVEAGLVVSAVGDIPNTEWLATSGLVTNGVLEVDSRGRLRPDIVAAGDVAAFPTVRGNKRIPLWTSAIEQAKTAALALLDGDDAPELDFQPYFWTEQFGLALKVCGHLPLDGPPEYSEGDPHQGKALMRWSQRDGSGTAVALNYRIPVPRLRKLSVKAPDPASAA